MVLFLPFFIWFGVTRSIKETPGPLAKDSGHDTGPIDFTKIKEQRDEYNKKEQDSKEDEEDKNFPKAS